MTRAALSTLDDGALTELLHRTGQPAWRAAQVRDATWQPYVNSFEDVRNLPASLRTQLAADIDFSTAAVTATRQADSGLTLKLLCRLRDGTTIETVAMETPPRGRTGRRATVCVSTQVGCAVGCPFCATGRLGLTRNCSAAEVVDQVRAASAQLAARALGPVTHVVYMGMGEPFANYEATVESVGVLVSRAGIGARRVTVSTSGVAPAIERFARDAPPVTLAVSLHAADDQLRDRLVPLNRTYPVAALVEAVSRYRALTGRRVSFEWCLIGGVNDSAAQADALRALAQRCNAHVNVIPMNRIQGSEWGPPQPAVARAFLARLHGVQVTVRDTRGNDIAAACGQLRAELETRRVQRADGSLTPPQRLVPA